MLIWCSICILDGPDDYFGEDDHMAHHYYTAVNHHELAAHQKTQKEVIDGVLGTA